MEVRAYLSWVTRVTLGIYARKFGERCGECVRGGLRWVRLWGCNFLRWSVPVCQIERSISGKVFLSTSVKCWSIRVRAFIVHNLYLLGVQGYCGLGRGGSFAREGSRPRRGDAKRRGGPIREGGDLSAGFCRAIGLLDANNLFVEFDARMVELSG